jgi:hypothetical protein
LGSNYSQHLQTVYSVSENPSERIRTIPPCESTARLPSFLIKIPLV